MGTKRFIATLTAAILLGGIGVYAQSAEVKVSREKVRFEGKVYYSHIVLEKQTLYSIAKAYEVSIEEIYAANKGLEEKGLKKDEVILIPIKEDTAQTKAEDSSKKKKTSAKVTYTGESIKHTVQWYEDLNSIARKYGVSEQAIIQVNNLKYEAVKARQVLIIPLEEVKIEEEVVPEVKEEEPVVIEEVVPEVKEEVVEEVVKEVVEEVVDSTEMVPVIYAPKNDITIMLMIPLKASSGGSNNYMDFYSGALLAAKDEAEKGIHINLNVIDVASGIPSGIEDREYDAADVIIGPVSPTALQTVLDKVQDNKYVVSPMDPKAESLLQTNGNLIQAPTPSGRQIEDLLEWIKSEESESDRVVVIYEKGSKEVADSSEINKAIEKSGLKVQRLSYGILEGRDIQGSLEKLMNFEGTNRVIVASDKEAFVSDAIRNAGLMLKKEYRMQLFAQSKVRSFETIETDNLHSSNTHMSLTYYVDYDNNAVKSFLMKYRALYNTEPTAFAYQGYDLLSYFAGIISEYGDNWADKLEEREEIKLLQENFKFKKTSVEGGYVNQSIKRIVYGQGYKISCQ